MANMPFFRVIYRSKPRGECDCKPRARLPGPRVRAARSAAAADVLQPRIHPRVFRADRIHVFCRIGFRSRSRRLCGCGSGWSGLIVAGQSGGGVRERFACARLGARGVGQRANRDQYDKNFHFNPSCPVEPAANDGSPKRTAIIHFNQRVFCIIASKMPVIEQAVHGEFQEIRRVWRRAHRDTFSHRPAGRRTRWYRSAEQKHTQDRS